MSSSPLRRPEHGRASLPRRPSGPVPRPPGRMGRTGPGAQRLGAIGDWAHRQGGHRRRRCRRSRVASTSVAGLIADLPSQRGPRRSRTSAGDDGVRDRGELGAGATRRSKRCRVTHRSELGLVRHSATAYPQHVRLADRSWPDVLSLGERDGRTRLEPLATAHRSCGLRATRTRLPRHRPWPGRVRRVGVASPMSGAGAEMFAVRTAEQPAGPPCAVNDDVWRASPSLWEHQSEERESLKSIRWLLPRSDFERCVTASAGRPMAAHGSLLSPTGDSSVPRS